MTTEAAASKAASPVSVASPIPSAATSSPLIAAVSSASTVRTSGSFELRSAPAMLRPRRSAWSCW